jgi:hypothetical protein
MTKEGTTTPHWKEFPKKWRDSNNNPIDIPVIYHFDGSGNYDAFVQPNLNNLALWEVWIDCPSRLVDDKVASKEEAIALAEQILGGE